MAYSLIITTCATKEDAKEIINALLGAKLAACVQTQEIESFYIWKGKAENSKEVILFIKTKSELYKEAETAILSRHKYETPEIVEIPFRNGYPGYLRWIDAVTKDSSHLQNF